MRYAKNESLCVFTAIQTHTPRSRPGFCGFTWWDKIVYVFIKRKSSRFEIKLKIEVNPIDNLQFRMGVCSESKFWLFLKASLLIKSTSANFNSLSIFHLFAEELCDEINNKLETVQKALTELEEIAAGAAPLIANSSSFEEKLLTCEKKLVNVLKAFGITS